MLKFEIKNKDSKYLEEEKQHLRRSGHYLPVEKEEDCKRLEEETEHLRRSGHDLHFDNQNYSNHLEEEKPNSKPSKHDALLLKKKDSNHAFDKSKDNIFSRLGNFLWRPSLRGKSAWTWFEILGNGILAGVLAIIFTWIWNDLSSKRADKLYRQQLVTNYIDSVQKLILDEYHQGDKEPDIGYPEIQTFIQAKTASTIKNLDNDQEQLKRLIDFLRVAHIGILPKEPEESEQINQNLNNGVEDPEDFTLYFFKGINLNNVSMNNTIQMCTTIPFFDIEICCPKIKFNADTIDFLKKKKLIESKKSPIELSYAIFPKADFSNAKLYQVVLTSADLTGSRFMDADMKQAKMGAAILEGAVLERADLRQADLTKTNLRDATLETAILNYSKLRAANIIGTDFETSSLVGVDWTYAIYDKNTKFFKEEKQRKDKEEKQRKELLVDNLCMIKIDEDKGIKIPDSRKCRDKAKKLKLNPFRNTNLSGMNLSNIKPLNKGQTLNFFKTNLSEANLQNANLKEANLTEADLTGADLTEADLTEAKLELANLKYSVTHDKKDPEMDLKWQVVAEIVKSNSKIDGQELNEKLRKLRQENNGKPDLRFAYLANSDLSKLDEDKLKELTEDRRINLRNAQLQGANLKGANLIGVDLTNANLGKGELNGVEIAVNLSEADLEQADLTGADLTGADLTMANLRDAILTGADLKDADLRKADLRDADLTGADLKDADLRKANLTDADLKDAKGFDPQESILCNTIMPSGSKNNSDCPKSSQAQ